MEIGNVYERLLLPFTIPGRMMDRHYRGQPPKRPVEPLELDIGAVSLAATLTPETGLEGDPSHWPKHLMKFLVDFGGHRSDHVTRL